MSADYASQFIAPIIGAGSDKFELSSCPTRLDVFDGKNKAKDVIKFSQIRLTLS